MITKAQAIDPNNRMFYCGSVFNADGTTPRRARRNGKTKTWKRLPDTWVMPVKWGLNNCFQLTEANSQHWYVTENEAIAHRELHYGVDGGHHGL